MEVDERERRIWTVVRTAYLETIERASGRHVWRVSVADWGREPFLNRWFNNADAAHDFMAQLESNAGSAWPSGVARELGAS